MKTEFIYILALFVISAIFLFGCSSDDDGGVVRNIPEENRLEIEAYLEENGLTAQVTENGVFYRIIEEGNLEQFPTVNNEVRVRYNGYKLSNGEVFDNGTLDYFPLSRLILGWQEALPNFSKGASGVIYVPAHMGYGSNSPSNNGVIVFDIELIDFR